LGEVVPKLLSGALGVRNDDAKNFAAADQAVVPAEVVIKDEFKGLWFAVAEGLEGEALGFGFETTAAERAGNLAIGIEQRLGAELLRARTFHARDDAERDGFVCTGRFREGLEQVFHHVTAVA
jgi:hypothetical protein